MFTNSLRYVSYAWTPYVFCFATPNYLVYCISIRKSSLNRGRVCISVQCWLSVTRKKHQILVDRIVLRGNEADVEFDNKFQMNIFLMNMCVMINWGLAEWLLLLGILHLFPNEWWSVKFLIRLFNYPFWWRDNICLYRTKWKRCNEL